MKNYHQNLIVALVRRHYAKGVELSLLYGHYNKYAQEAKIKKLCYEDVEKIIKNSDELVVEKREQPHGFIEFVKPR